MKGVAGPATGNVVPATLPAIGAARLIARSKLSPPGIIMAEIIGSENPSARRFFRVDSSKAASSLFF